MGCYFRPLVAYLQAHRLAVLFRRINGNLDRRNAAEVGNEPQVTKWGRAVLDRQTVQGLCWALKFVCQLHTAYMSEKELKHAIRLTHFRGAVCPEFQA